MINIRLPWLSSLIDVIINILQCLSLVEYFQLDAHMVINSNQAHPLPPLISIIFNSRKLDNLVFNYIVLWKAILDLTVHFVWTFLENSRFRLILLLVCCDWVTFSPLLVRKVRFKLVSYLLSTHQPGVVNPIILIALYSNVAAGSKNFSLGPRKFDMLKSWKFEGVFQKLENLGRPVAPAWSWSTPAPTGQVFWVWIENF